MSIHICLITLQPEKITYINFVFGINLLKNYISVTKTVSGINFRTLHYTYAFAIPRTTWKIVWELSSWKVPFQSFSNRCSIQSDYRDIFLGESHFQLQIQSRAASRNNPLQRQLCGNVGRKPLVTDTDSPLNLIYFPLQIQTSGSKQRNSLIMMATTVFTVKNTGQGLFKLIR